ncbi:YbhB/YbcL family Raf kinase inhibitor-like protein [Crenobacter sp. SG2303]|uniref:YbhB/YbcL family Raf kinase inhibitor-like protein n=1 Tax=Crenobacter oryzisoli TaxID=3056844 RepID=A0ABT7XKT7_9NEIS|nr:YbhB/YbcL family Raf kinase inhibitor-like protein [Crenobacter sp. SG2303]MDN0074199.1 YbhB/YbcL family Raf kinase inhibitor-like protein [Crenobacter sp. SG2303]
MRTALFALLLIAAVAASAFQLTSRDIAPGATLSLRQVYNGHGCVGSNRSPALSWQNPPTGTKSFALTLYDPDAPGKGWWHWVVFDLPANSRGLPTGAGSGTDLPAGARQGRNDFGETGYGGACPPEGDVPHRYVLTVYALKVAHIALPPDASPSKFALLFEQNALAKTSLTARYGR